MQSKRLRLFSLKSKPLFAFQLEKKKEDRVFNIKVLSIIEYGGKKVIDSVYENVEYIKEYLQQMLIKCDVNKMNSYVFLMR